MPLRCIGSRGDPGSHIGRTSPIAVWVATEGIIALMKFYRPEPMSQLMTKVKSFEVDNLRNTLNT